MTNAGVVHPVKKMVAKEEKSLEEQVNYEPMLALKEKKEKESIEQRGKS